MRILFVTENFPPESNAAASRVYERACYWVRWGHQVTVLTTAPNFPSGKLFAGYKNRWYQTEQIDGIRVVRVKTFISANEGFFRRSLDFFSFLVTGFFGGIIQPRSDVVVATSPQFFSAVLGWALGAVRRWPFVFELGDLWPASIAAVGAMRQSLALRLLEKLELFLYRRAAAVVALTAPFKHDLVARGIPAGKIAVVINGVDLSRYRPEPRDAELAAALGLSGKFVAGYIGTLGLSHDLENVLHAAERLREDERVRFLFVGAGAAREALVAEAERRGLTNVVFVPRQPKEAMPRYWSLCDLALVQLKDTPVFETVIPSKIFEAMGMGVPILLVAPAGEASRIVLGEGAGEWIPAGKPEQLAAAVRSLVDDPERLRQLRANSHRAAPNHTRERQAAEMMAVLERVVAGEGSEVGSAQALAAAAQGTSGMPLTLGHERDER